MRKVFAIVVGATVLASARTVNAVPVVPNFTQGSNTGLDDLKYDHNFHCDRDHK